MNWKMKAVLPISIMAFVSNAIMAIWPNTVGLRLFGLANAFYCLGMIAIAIILNKEEQRQKMIDDLITSPENQHPC
jgi:hypothetical protein